MGCTTAQEEGKPVDASADVVDASADSAARVGVIPQAWGPRPEGTAGLVVRREAALRELRHQSSAPGDEVLSGQTEAAVRGFETAFGSNLTPDPDTGMDAWDAASIVGALRQGIDESGQPLCPAMPRYEDMSDEESLAIAAYLQSLTAVHHDIPASVCPPIEPSPDAGADAAADFWPRGTEEPTRRPGRARRASESFQKCSYIINLPCGGTYEQSNCYLLLLGDCCATLCDVGCRELPLRGGVRRRQSDVLDAGEPAKIECFIPTSIICGAGVDF